MTLDRISPVLNGSCPISAPFSFSAMPREVAVAKLAEADEPLVGDDLDDRAREIARIDPAVAAQMGGQRDRDATRLAGRRSSSA